MKKLTLGLAAVGLTASLGAYAALPTGAAPFRINVPNLKSGFTFNLTGLYWRPTYAALDYATAYRQTAPATTNTYTIHRIDPTYKWGFQVGLGYVFPNSGNDVQVDWTHLNASYSDSIHVHNFNAGTNYVVPIFIGNLQNPYFPFSEASSHVNFKYNAVDLNVGQYVSVGTRLQLRLHAGARYAEIRKTQTADYNDQSVAQQVMDESPSDLEYTQIFLFLSSLDATSSSKMVGFGPRFGVDASYHFTHHFGLVGGLATSLLVSRLDGNLTGAFTFPKTSGPRGSRLTTVYYYYPLHKVDRIVPELDGKLGVDYSHVFNGSVFSIEGGYKIDHYFDALTSVRLGATTFATARDDHSVSFDGPYVSLNLKV